MMYQLTQYQFNKITETIRKDSVVFVVPTVTDTDNEHAHLAFTEELRDANELVEIGLAINVSDKFRNAINAITVTGRGYEAFMLTPAAVSLFCGLGACA